MDKRNSIALLSLFGAVLLVTAACACWGLTFPAPGDRALPGDRLLALRCGAVAFGAAAQGALLAGCLPLLLKPRLVYRAAGLSFGVVAALAGSGAVALSLVK